MSDYVITEKMKGIWDVEIDLLAKFDEFCRKNDLKYTIDYGTLLGAVRHKGFIPWDDDVDVIMFRPDYNKMLSIADEYFEPPYYFQHFYKDKGIPTWGLSKLMNDNTACIEKREVPPGYHSGIFLDIFVFDDVLGDKGQDLITTKTIYEMYYLILYPDKLQMALNQGYQPVMPESLMRDIIRMNDIEKSRLLETFLEENFGKTERVAWVLNAMVNINGLHNKKRKRSWYDETVYLDFEGLKLPAPVGYEQVLAMQYGEDYMTPKQLTNDHDGAFFDPYKSYREYMD